MTNLLEVLLRSCLWIYVKNNFCSIYLHFQLMNNFF